MHCIISILISSVELLRELYILSDFHIEYQKKLCRNSETTAPSAWLAGQAPAVSQTDHAAATSAAVGWARLTLVPASPPSVILPALLTFVKNVSNYCRLACARCLTLKIIPSFLPPHYRGYRYNADINLSVSVGVVEKYKTVKFVLILQVAPAYRLISGSSSEPEDVSLRFL